MPGSGPVRSGNKINRAGDDAAGLAISEKMRSSSPPRPTRRPRAFSSSWDNLSTRF